MQCLVRSQFKKFASNQICIKGSPGQVTGSETVLMRWMFDTYGAAKESHSIQYSTLRSSDLRQQYTTLYQWILVPSGGYVYDRMDDSNIITTRTHPSQSDFRLTIVQCPTINRVIRPATARMVASHGRTRAMCGNLGSECEISVSPLGSRHAPSEAKTQTKQLSAPERAHSNTYTDGSS